MRDLKFALRMLAKSPGFSLVAILSLALGIGANTAIFSLVNALLLRPLPVQDPQSLVTVSTTDQRNPGNLPVSHLNFKDLRAQNSVFSDMAAITFNQVNYAHGQESEQIPVQVVTANFFAVIGAEPPLGRGFRAEEEIQGTPVAVVSYGFWERSLGSDKGIIGKTITLNRTPYTVVGVAARNFTGVFLGGGPSAWVPMSRNLVPVPEWYETRRGLFLGSVARLKSGVTIEQARSNLRTIFASLEQAFPVDNKGRSATAVPLLQARLNPNGLGANVLVQQSTVLMIVVGIVLLIACANIANLLLSRAAKRRREIAIRLALGAKRVRLIRQLLTESLLLSILGGIAGMGLASWTLSAIVAAKLPLPFPIDRAALSLDPRVLAFTGGLAILTGILFGLAPALQASKADVVPVLKNELVPSGAGHRGLRGFLTMRQVLVVVQVALSLMALIAAGLFLRELRHAQEIDTGFETRGVLVMNFNLLREGYTPERGTVFYDQIVQKAAALPGVSSAAIAQAPPLAGGLARSVFPEGADTTTTGRILVQVNTVGLGYFQTIGIPLVRGRDFTRGDTAESPKVVIVNETMAKQFWKGEEPIGKRFKFFGDKDYTTVIGVAKDSKYNGVAEDPQNFIYQPLGQNYTAQGTLHVRSAGDAASLANAVRAAARELDPSISVFNIRTLAEQVSNSLQPLLMNVLILAVFGTLALLLASIGLYGVASYAVSQRTREIGVRMALGAQPSSVVGLVLGHGMILVAAGLGVGLAAAYAAAGLMRALVTGVSTHDPVTFGGTAGALALIALVASYIPARRATRIDPLIALRTD
ncbi:MAG TPA: ABC transporter permease [Vicinamibacterales bacterium]|nr:ABC transporter permease [Vicinamibacterales bacterium]